MSKKRSLVLMFALAGLAWTFAVLNAYSLKGETRPPAWERSGNEVGSKDMTISPYSHISLPTEFFGTQSPVAHSNSYLTFPSNTKELTGAKESLVENGGIPLYGAVSQATKYSYEYQVQSYPVASAPTAPQMISRGGGTCTVNTTADSGTGSFRNCLSTVNPGDTIDFDATVFPPGTPATINLITPLPWITDNDLTIDASMAGVILNGENLPPCDPSPSTGLVINGADNVTIRGLQILNFLCDGIAIVNGASNNVIGGNTPSARNIISGNTNVGIVILLSANGNQVIGNYIGTNATGDGSFGNWWGVLIGASAFNNTIGGDTVQERNIISGNQFGIQFQDSGTTGNQIAGNYIGLNAAGNSALSNFYGVVLLDGPQNNTIGGTSTGTRNIISGNVDVGILLSGATTANNQITGNYIGTNISGNASLANEDGISIELGSHHNTIGGTTSGTRNVVSGNTLVGIKLLSPGTTNNEIKGNYIGVGATGAMVVSNYWGVVLVNGPQNNTVGGDTSTERNIISGNTSAGVQLQGSNTNNNVVSGNYIGTDATGSLTLSNTIGVALNSVSNNTVGGTTSGHRNIISGNLHGIEIINDANNNNVRGNYIGTDTTGNVALGNNLGILVSEGANHNVIGGSTSGTRNVISGNVAGGIVIQNSGSDANQVLGNFIGTNATGTAALGNGNDPNGDGIVVLDGAQNSIIGDATSGGRNILSGHTGAGINLQGEDTTGTQIQGNYIGTDITGMFPITNTWGIVSVSSPDNVIGGDTASGRNLISSNTYGIQFQGIGADNNQVMGNYIGTNVNGTGALGNYAGIFIRDTAQNNVIGGTVTGVRNVISGNEVGIIIESILTGDTNNNLIQGNYIGTNANGTIPLGNETGVIIGADAHNNVIGGEIAGARNIISGNIDEGIRIQDIGATDNFVLGNYIGTDHTGTQRLGNLNGIVIGFGAQNNVVGGNSAAVRNIISGNTGLGIAIAGWDTSETSGNQIKGNYIGLDLNGTIPLSNTVGVVIGGPAIYNIIGGNGISEGNVIGGNLRSGIQIEGAGADYNEIKSNLIGTNATGSIAVGNFRGVVILDAQHNVVGGPTATMRNIIGGNVAGVVLEGANTSANQVSGNYIGTDVTGLTALGNNWGIVIHFDAANNVIGGTTVGARNVISGNEGTGIAIEGNASHNQVIGNLIGTDMTGLAALGNETGIMLGFGAAFNVIGGANANARNVISGNREAGIQIQNAETTQNQVFGNFIGTDESGSLPIPNLVGVALIGGAHHNAIGSDVAGTGNVISANDYYGIEISNFEPKGDGTSENTVQGNFIGTDVTGETSLGNLYGVIIFYGAHDNIIGNGTPESGNLISGNLETGVVIAHYNSTDNVISNNTIGPDASGAPLGNGSSGVLITDAEQNTIGISNTIAFNGLDGGIVISGTQTIENTITRNLIFGNDGPAIHFINGPIPIPPAAFLYDSLSHTVSGNTCSACIVEVFAYAGSELAGMRFMGPATADNQGDFSLVIPALPAELPCLSATVTEDGMTYPFFAVGTDACADNDYAIYLPVILR